MTSASRRRHALSGRTPPPFPDRPSITRRSTTRRRALEEPVTIRVHESPSPWHLGELLLLKNNLYARSTTECKARRRQTNRQNRLMRSIPCSSAGSPYRTL